MTKLQRKSWKIRVLRYMKILLHSLQSLDPNSTMFKSHLKIWISQNIDKEGDYIFKGKPKPPKNDWLQREVAEWRRREAHNIRSLEEFEDISED